MDHTDNVHIHLQRFIFGKTYSGFTYGMGMAFYDKMSLTAVQNAVFAVKNAVLMTKTAF